MVQLLERHLPNNQWCDLRRGGEQPWLLFSRVLGDMSHNPLYSVGTWDPELECYTPQVDVPAFNLTLWQLRAALKQLRQLGYSAHRYRDADGGHEDNDTSVLVERTDGMAEADILKRWER